MVKIKIAIKTLIFLSAFALSTNIANAGVQGSKHDFSNLSWNDGGEICNVCHTPHNANPANLDSPLWNHNITIQTFILYTSPTMKTFPEQPRSVSKACLSCHDGTIALDSFGGNTGSTFVGGNAEIGTDLSNDHPVSLKWTHQNQTGCSDCHSAHNGNPFGGDLIFFDGYIECATCHDVHDGAGFPKMLRKTPDYDLICFHCHGK